MKVSDNNGLNYDLKDIFLQRFHLAFVKKIVLSGTFKMKKMDLQREGFNPQQIEDRMFFYDVVKGAYRQLDACLYNDIVEMRCRL